MVKRSKNFILEKYSKNKRNEVLIRKNNIIVENKDELKKYVYEAFTNLNSKKSIHLGQLSKENIGRIINEISGIKNTELKELFNDNKEYDISINQDTIRHIKKNQCPFLMY